MSRAAPPQLTAYIGLATVFLLGPIVVAVPLSFGNVSQRGFPPPGYNLQRCEVAWDNRNPVDGFVVSTIIAAIGSAMAGVAGTPAAPSGYDIRLERAAQPRGASRLRTFLDIAYPAVRPGMIAGVAFAFLMSFDNVAMSIFLARDNRLPLRLRMLRRRDIGNLA